MSEAIEQIENADWDDFTSQHSVGIPLALGTIIVVTGVSVITIRRKLRENRARKAQLGMTGRLGIRKSKK